VQPLAAGHVRGTHQTESKRSQQLQACVSSSIQNACDPCVQVVPAVYFRNAQRNLVARMSRRLGANRGAAAAAAADAYASGASPIWRTPASRGATALPVDDEFDSVTIDPNYVFRDLTTGPTIRTANVGAINENAVITGATTPPNVALHTVGRRSHMLVQLSTTGPVIYQIYKPFTWVAGRVYYSRGGRMLRKVGTVGTSGNYSLAMWASNGGAPDTNNRCGVLWDLANQTGRWVIVVGGVSSNVTFAMGEGMGMPAYAAISNPAGVLSSSANWFGEFFTDDGQRFLPVAPGGASFAWTPAFIGWQVQQDMNMNGLFSVDFVRENVGHPLYNQS
jgi:hypothetical protein